MVMVTVIGKRTDNRLDFGLFRSGTEKDRNQNRNQKLDIASDRDRKRTKISFRSESLI